MKKKKIISSVLTVVMLFTLCIPVSSYAAAFSDTAGHWAETYIDQAVGYGFVNGYPDGTFLPDKSVSRAEFATMVNKALKNNSTASTTFNDVPYGEWYYNDISKAVAATYVAGYDDNTFRPSSPITRQEAAVVISRIVPTYSSSGNLNAYGDRSSVADWAYTAFQKVNGKGYIGAYDDGNLHPLDKLTRAQTAKIICDILGKEKIVTTDPVVKSNNTTLSNTIYSNGVTIHADLGDGNATIENCIILGNLSVQGGGDDTVTISNSRIAQGSVEKSSSSVRLLVKGETVISALTAAKTAAIQTSNLAGGLYGSGIGSLTTLSSSDITLQGSFPKVTVNGSSSKLKLTSGSITNLVISNNAKNSDITVDSNASVGTADVNAESYFHGTGTITKMNANAGGITYEKKPSSVSTGSQYDEPKLVDPEGDIKFSPANGAKKVSLSTKITITFSSAMKLYDGKAITDSNISDFVSLREKTSGGTELDFTATINSAKTVITIKPDAPLEDDTKYYVIIAKNEIKDSNGDGNKAQSVSFSTGTDSDVMTFSPKDGATGVSIDVEPTITFSETIETYDGDSITKSYLTDSVITFREGSSSGTKVPFTATISSNKTITITPKSSLKEDQKYYLAIATKKFRTKSGSTNIEAENVTWTTSTDAANLPSAPQNFTATPGDKQVALSWAAPSNNGGYTITKYEVSRDNSSSWTSAGTSTSYTYTGLTNGTSYTFKVRAVNSKGAGTTASVTATPQATTPPAETDAEAVAAAKSALSFESNATLSDSNPKTFAPTGTRTGVDYSYAMSLDDPAGFTIEGLKLTASDFSSDYTRTLTITATIKKGSVTDTKVFEITINVQKKVVEADPGSGSGD